MLRFSEGDAFEDRRRGRRGDGRSAVPALRPGLPGDVRRRVARHASRADSEQLARDLRSVHRAVAEQAAAAALEQFAGKWGARCPAVFEVWFTGATRWPEGGVVNGCSCQDASGGASACVRALRFVPIDSGHETLRGQGMRNLAVDVRRVRAVSHVVRAMKVVCGAVARGSDGHVLVLAG